MDPLTRAFDPARPGRGRLLAFRLRVFAPFLAMALGGLVSDRLGWTAVPMTKILGVAGFHGGLLAASLAGAWEGARGWGPPAALIALSLLIAAAACTLGPWGCLAYLLPLAALARVIRRHPECGRLGLGRGVDWSALAGGVLGGCFLGAHLLFSASRTLGYPVRPSLPAAYLAGVLYDAGANVLSAECFFRGTLFNRWQRRWSFWPAALATTGLSILRYLADPALPRALELMVGAVFYLALLSLLGCALLWRSGSLFPSLGASFVFFAA